jgi:hypothetical protein
MLVAVFLKLNKMSKFKNKTIQKGGGKDFFLICKILERLENKEEIDFIRDYIEKISISNQECIRLLENIYSHSVSISQAE